MEVGDVVAARYTIEGVLGRGGMSTVYCARDDVLERRVALKVLHERHSGDPAYVERFRREARAIARLSHPNIVTVIDRGEVDTHEFIVFELVEGENLKQLVAVRGGRLSVSDALAFVCQAARGLAYAHEHGIVHRDVKPQNVLVDTDGVAKVTDFGIARSLDPEHSLTESGTILGTGDYLSPEQATGAAVDARSDQYSLGVLLFELLVGEVPYPGESVVAAAARHVHDPVPSARERRPDVPPRVDALVRRAMAKRPDDRFPTMGAFIAALEASLAEAQADGRPVANDAGETAVISPVPAPARDRPRARRRGGVPWRLLAGLLVLAVGGAFVWALATDRVDPTGDGDGTAAPESVTLTAVRDWDPEGGDGEHPELVGRATDGDRATYWTTETYGSFSKSGVGIVLDAGRPVELGKLRVVSDTPGFTARIQAGRRGGGPFTDVSEEVEVGERTTFELDTGGDEHRYYVVWITALDGLAHLNEIRPA